MCVFWNAEQQELAGCGGSDWPAAHRSRAGLREGWPAHDTHHRVTSGVCYHECSFLLFTVLFLKLNVFYLQSYRFLKNVFILQISRFFFFNYSFFIMPPRQSKRSGTEYSGVCWCVASSSGLCVWHSSPNWISSKMLRWSLSLLASWINQTSTMSTSLMFTLVEEVCAHTHTHTQNV